MPQPNRVRARELAAQSRVSGDPVGWFDQLYQEQEQGLSVVPWADSGANPNLVEFFEQNPIAAEGRTALTVGCGFGDDAEQLAALGFKTTAFDVSPTAIRAAKQRFPGTQVDYRTADVLVPPVEWESLFDFVLESYTLQVLPPALRPKAVRAVAGFVNEGGAVLVIARAREEDEDEGQMPWPLTHRELELFKEWRLREKSFEDYFDKELPPVRRFRALFVK
jgi:SAM-dependent methyltransferase